MADKERKTEPHNRSAGLEIEPDAWERFERAVDVVVKSSPKHRRSASQAKSGKSAPTRARKRVQKKPGQ